MPKLLLLKMPRGALMPEKAAGVAPCGSAHVAAADYAIAVYPEGELVVKDRFGDLDLDVLEVGVAPGVSEVIARAFHNEYEAWAERYGWETQEASRVGFDELPPENRQAMISTVMSLLDRGFILPGESR